jgi:hypothetical protein
VDEGGHAPGDADDGDDEGGQEGGLTQARARGDGTMPAR